MPLNNPRTYEYLMEGVAWSLAESELDRVEAFARAHFTGAALEGLVAAIGAHRQMLQAPGRKAGPEAETILPLYSPFEQMMDEIAAATSVAEIDHLAAEFRALFAGHPDLAELEPVADTKRRFLAGDVRRPA